MQTQLTPPITASPAGAARNVYFSLLDGGAGRRELANAADFLCTQLSRAEHVDSDLPTDMHGLQAWMEASVERVGHQYQEYLDARHAGAKRRYFTSKSHALYFLKNVAPTKMVDGAWLYGVLEHWQDARFLSLIRTYLEELGEGSPEQNHVGLYKKLLAAHGDPRWDDLSDAHYIQGAIQLSMAYHADHFLPEIIGYNLGYEQLPLHLLITAYELQELRIDPYYFTLHVTVDNADSGHARAAVQSVHDAAPKTGNLDEWYQRVQNGYRLNELGACTTSVIASFDLEREIREIFARKATIGKYAHSDYRRIDGQTVNEWLSEPDKIDEFIAAMERSGWFKRHQAPQNSRFWKLISGGRGKMAGVFNAYERQVIYDWLAGDALGELPASPRAVANSARPSLSFEEKQQLLHSLPTHHAGHDSEFEVEERELEVSLQSAQNTEETVKTLIALMSPATHHTPAGLAATRLFSELMS